MSKDLRRADFPYCTSLPTRWMDNDVYGHVNNVTYYSYFDTVVNRMLIEAGVLDIHAGETVGFVVSSGCSYYSPVAFPDVLTVGMRVARIGNSSVSYELGIFKEEQETPAAFGQFVHVYVDRATGQSVAVPEQVREALARLAVNQRD